MESFLQMDLSFDRMKFALQENYDAVYKSLEHFCFFLSMEFDVAFLLNMQHILEGQLFQLSWDNSGFSQFLHICFWKMF